MIDGHTARYDTPWRRLPWTAPFAVLTWSVALWALSNAMTRTTRVPERILAVDARFVELPEPPAPPPPFVRPDPPVKHPVQRAAPASTPEPITAPPTEQAVSDTTQSAETAPQSTVQTAAASAPTRTAYAMRHPGATIRTESVGVVEPPRGLTIMNEDNPFDDEGTGKGWSPGGWTQEANEPCPDDTEGWQNSCGRTDFGRPLAPWCYNADPVHPWEIGTCKRDLDRATTAYKRENYPAAFAQLKKLAEKEYAPAQSNLASMYAEGVGVAKDEQQAVFWWRKAAKEGDIKAIYNLALMYSDGKGVARDDRQAAYWFRKAAYYGYEFAQYNLGVMYALGTGVPQDGKLSAFWYRKAANQGNAIAQYNLAVMHAEGAGVPRSDKQAVFWYCRAATRGHPTAKSNLIQVYSTGTDVPKDEELAYFCWLLASPNRAAPRALADRAIFTKTLSSEQRANAEAAYVNWKAK